MRSRRSGRSTGAAATRGHGSFSPFAGPVHPAGERGHRFRRELIVGQWALVPWFAKTAKLPYATVNARSEELEAKASFKHPWARGQRCIIPAESFDEPNWETGKNVWWRFARADGMPWGVAGLWNTWTDKASGEVVESYTMLTLNADHHPLMNRMLKPDPKLGPDQQDKHHCCCSSRRTSISGWPARSTRLRL